MGAVALARQNVAVLEVEKRPPVDLFHEIPVAPQKVVTVPGDLVAVQDDNAILENKKLLNLF
jgi:hypothetical protein